MQIFYSIVLLICFAFSAQAEGLSMHGTPLYSLQSTHFDVVNSQAPKNGTLRRAVVGAFDTLNPFTIKGTSADGLNLFYDRLMDRHWDEPFTLYPLIAQKVKMNEERTSLEMHLDPRAVFHDGTPITTQDVLFSFNILKEKGKPAFRRIYGLVDRLEIIDNHHLIFHFGMNSDYETAMIVAMMPVLSQAWWAQNAFDVTTLNIPNGSGPYMIEDVEAGRRIIYKRNPDYWARDIFSQRGQHNFDRIIYEYFRDDTIAQEAFFSQNLSIRFENDINRWQAAYPDQEGIIKQELTHGRPQPFHVWAMNTRRAPFDDVRVRKALNLAFDGDYANRAYYYDKAKRIACIFPNATDFCTDTDISEQDKRARLIQARNLLEEAGYALKDGSRFIVELILNSRDEEKLALSYKRNLARLGVILDVRVVDSAHYVRRLQDFDYDMVTMRVTSSLSPGNEQKLYWSCNAAQTAGTRNYAGICDPLIDEAIDTLIAARSRENLALAARDLSARVMAGNYVIPLFYYPFDMVAYWDELGRPEKTPLYGVTLENWWYKLKEKEGGLSHE